MAKKTIDRGPINVNKIEVFYDNKDNRKVKCSCGKILDRTITPHIKKEHNRDWKKWRLDFVRLYNKGWSVKKIMWKYRALFTWTLIEKEIRKLSEENPKLVKLNPKNKIFWPPENVEIPTTSVWSFPNRGDWSVHDSKYRGNWPPQIPRILIQKYAKSSMVLDPFTGSSTTLVEAWINNKKSIGIDISPVAVKISKSKISQMRQKNPNLKPNLKPKIIRGDAENMIQIISKLGLGEESIDLICAHPPYIDALKYSEEDEDLSKIKDPKIFCDKMEKIAESSYKVLKKNGICAILLGDVRKGGTTIPLGFLVMERFLKQKFNLEHLIIKLQHKDKSNEFYHNKNYLEFPISHEYLLIFRKL